MLSVKPTSSAAFIMAAGFPKEKEAIRAGFFEENRSLTLSGDQTHFCSTWTTFPFFRWFSMR